MCYSQTTVYISTAIQATEENGAYSRFVNFEHFMDGIFHLIWMVCSIFFMIIYEDVL
jgi:hypothetical protein